MIAELAARHGIRGVTGVLHLGAHHGEEADDYEQLDWAAGSPLVIWVEADPHRFAALEANLTGRRGHHLFVEALVDAESGRDVTLHLASNDGASSSVLDFGTHATHLPHIGFVGERDCVTVTVDDLASVDDADRFEFVNLLVMDLQGLELRALRGAGALLEHVDWVIAEVNREEVYEGCPMVEEIDAYLTGFDRVETIWTEWGYGDALWVRR